MLELSVLGVVSLSVAAITNSNLFEYLLGLIGILGALTSFIFFLANLKNSAITEQRLLAMAERQQRRWDRIKVLLALEAARRKDIENYLANKDLEKDGFFKRSEFPEQGLPSEDTEM